MGLAWLGRSDCIGFCGLCSGCSMDSPSDDRGVREHLEPGNLSSRSRLGVDLCFPSSIALDRQNKGAHLLNELQTASHNSVINCLVVLIHTTLCTHEFLIRDIKCSFASNFQEYDSQGFMPAFGSQHENMALWQWH